MTNCQFNGRISKLASAFAIFLSFTLMSGEATAGGSVSAPGFTDGDVIGVQRFRWDGGASSRSSDFFLEGVEKEISFHAEGNRDWRTPARNEEFERWMSKEGSPLFSGSTDKTRPFGNELLEYHPVISFPLVSRAYMGEIRSFLMFVAENPDKLLMQFRKREEGQPGDRERHDRYLKRVLREILEREGLEVKDP